MIQRVIRYFVFILFIAVEVNDLYGQDAIFSQYYASRIYLNPAYVGLEHSFNAGVVSRQQWRGIGTSGYMANHVYAIFPFYSEGLRDENKGGLGFSIYQNSAGDFGYNDLSANVNGAYNIRIGSIGHNTFSFGLQLGAIHKRVNSEKIEWGSQFNRFVGGYDPSRPADDIALNGSASKTMLDVGSGVMFYRKPDRDRRTKGIGFWAGGSAYHINRPNESIFGASSKMPMLIKGVAGFEKTFGTRLNFSPNFIYAMQGNQSQMNAGLYLTWLRVEPESDFVPSEFILGGWYRLDESIIGMIGIGAATYVIGFSYDMNQSDIQSFNTGTGTWEVTLRIIKPRKEKVKRYYNPRI